MQNNDIAIRGKKYAAAKEIKASAHYAYVVSGVTLDGKKFDKAAFVDDGTCIGKNAEGKYEPWKDAGLTDPLIMDESVQFKLTDDGENPDITVGQCLVHGAVYESMLTGCTAAFKTAVGGSIRFVS